MQREHLNFVKIGAYLLLLLVYYLLETSVGLRVSILGIHPDVLPVAVAAAALLDGPAEGAIVGFAAGVLYDVALVSVQGLYPAFYMLFGVAAGFVSRRFLRKIWPSAVLLTAAAMITVGGLRYVFYLLLMKQASFLLSFQALCAEVLLTAALSPLVFFPYRRLSRRFKDPA